MMCRRSAFTLIELVWYLAMLVGLLYVIFWFYTLVHKYSFQRLVFCSQIIQDHSVLDVLRRDLLSASVHPNNWDVESIIFKKELVTSFGDENIGWVGWRSVNGGVHRMKGLYDPVRKRWIKKRTYFFRCFLHCLTMKLVLDMHTRRIIGVQIQWKNEKQQEKRYYVRMRNRVIVDGAA